MRIQLWCPFISEVATVKTVINTVSSIKLYSRNNIDIDLINSFGEWSNKKNKLDFPDVNIYNFYNLNFDKFLPKYGFLSSRIKYILIFISSFFKLHKLIKKNKADYFICFLITSLPLVLISIFKYETKFILRISGLPKLNFFRLTLWKLVSKRLFLVTCPTKETQKYIKKLNIFNPEKVVFLPEPVISIKEFLIKKKNYKIENSFNNKDSILFIGRLTKQKNILFLINALNYIFKKQKNLKLFIIGEGEEKKNIVKLIQQLKLENKVYLLGFQENVYSYLQNCKCFVLSSLWEDPGYVLIEAAMANTVIISSNCPNGPSEILENGNAGYLFKSNNFEDFNTKFEEFLSSDDKQLYAKKLSAKKAVKIYTIFGHYKYLKKYLNI